MDTKEIIKFGIEQSGFITRRYLEDLTDAELMVRPVPGANHVAWQLGHLITSANHMLTGIGQQVPALPDGFAELHSRETASSDDPKKFCNKKTYLDLLDQTFSAALKSLSRLPDSEFDKPGPETMRAYLPTAGSTFHMIGAHVMMHVGQFAVVRRKLGKPIVI